MRVLMIGTCATVPFVLTGSGGAQDPFMSTSFAIRGQEKWGSTFVDPVVVRNYLVVAEDTSNAVLAVKFDLGSDGYQSQDLSIMASHLFETGTITAQAYARSPYSVVWQRHSSGKLLGLTFMPEQELWAWHVHDTQGEYEDLCVIREGEEHVLYYVVKRHLPSGDKHYIERMASRKITKTSPWKDYVFLDSAIVYDGGPATHFTGLDHLEGMSVMALGDGYVQGPFTVTGGAIDLGEAASQVVIGLPYISEAEVLDAVDKKIDITEVTKRVLEVTVRVRNSRGFEVSAGGKIRPALVREVAQDFGQIPLINDFVTVNPGGVSDMHGRVTVMQRDPLPLSILSITREVDCGS